jgi:hypothetical protein
LLFIPGPACWNPESSTASTSTTSYRRSSACRALTAYCGGWRRCACLDAKTRGLAVGVLVSTTYNNLPADLLPTREVPCAWPAPALAGWCCCFGVLPLGTWFLVLVLVSG